MGEASEARGIGMEGGASKVLEEALGEVAMEGVGTGETEGGEEIEETMETSGGGVVGMVELTGAVRVLSRVEAV